MKDLRVGRAAAAGMLLLPLTAAMCRSMDVPAADPRVSALATGIEGRAAALYAALPAQAPPGCGFEANAATYGTLRAKAAELGTIAAATPADGSLNRAVKGLADVLAGAEQSHRLASASTDDRFGVCMAPRAITANAGAVARATGAILDLQRERGR